MFDMTEEKSIVMVEGNASLPKEVDLPKSITSKKLNGTNYMAWAHAVKIFLQEEKMLKYLTNNQPNKKYSLYGDWMSEDSIILE